MAERVRSGEIVIKKAIALKVLRHESFGLPRRAKPSEYDSNTMLTLTTPIVTTFRPPLHRRPLYKQALTRDSLPRSPWERRL